jgi:predicted enzyme related to lactoylglutathione lyase
MNSHDKQFIAISPQFSVPDIIKTAEYYKNVLGFSIERCFPPDDPVVAIVLREGASIILDKSAMGIAMPNHVIHGVGYDAYIAVNEIDRLYEEYKTTGARIVEGPVDRDYEVREMVVEDINGFNLAFGQELG